MDFIRPFFAGKNNIVQLIFLLLFVLAGMIIFSALATLVCSAIYDTTTWSKAANPAAFLRITQTITSIGSFLLPALLFSFCQDKKWFHFNACDRQPHYLLVNVTLVLSIVLLPIVAALAGWNESMVLPEKLSGIEKWMRSMEDTVAQMQYVMTFQHTYGTLIANMLVLALLPAVCEEFIFQGALQRFLHKNCHMTHAAIWITAFVFSTIHMEFYGFLPRFLLGVYLGYLYYWSRSLWLPILAHFLHNVLSLLVDFTFAGRGILIDQVRFTDIRGAVPMLLTCSLVTAMSLVFMWKVQKDFNTPEWD